jgi:ribonuclease H2 subunit B
METSMLFIVNANILSNNSDKFIKIVKLPHPTRVEEYVQYLISDDTLFELQVLNGNLNSSWFIDDVIHKDGSLYVATPIDPLFLLLPLLVQHRKKSADYRGYFCTLEQILSQTECDIDQTSLLMKLKNLNPSLICDKKG